MNPILIICILFLIVIIGYLFTTWIIRKQFKKKHPEIYFERYDYTEDDVLTVLQNVFVNRWIYGRKLVITMRYATKTYGNHTRREMIRSEYWTDKKKKDIHLDGYRVVRGMHDSLLWLGVGVYMRVKNAQYFDVPDTKTNGKFDYPQDTGETLHDYASSNATQKFIAAMSKTAISNMDTHTLIMIIILAVGAIFGMHLFGVF